MVLRRSCWLVRPNQIETLTISMRKNGQWWTNQQHSHSQSRRGQGTTVRHDFVVIYEKLFDGGAKVSERWSWWTFATCEML